MGKKLNLQVTAAVDVSDFLADFASFTQDDKALIQLADGVLQMVNDERLVRKFLASWNRN